MENVCSMMPGVFRNEGIVLMRTREKIESGKVKERKFDRKKEINSVIERHGQYGQESSMEKVRCCVLSSHRWLFGFKG